ncbi:hypothetical protein Misp02_34820 [Microtetraspora sp. NBRC 16547]|nr:hypothetical protein Misp02_34820 [Microtetraspora sp. NBRC 16547]
MLHRECRNLFPGKMFADLFAQDGRRSVLPMIVAVVMLLQRLEGWSDREPVDRFAFGVRWKYAAGGLDFDHPDACTRCWWTCARGWPPRIVRTGSSTGRSRWPARREPRTVARLLLPGKALLPESILLRKRH